MHNTRKLTFIYAVLTNLYFLIGSTAYGQSNGCDTIYSFVEVTPEYENDALGLLKYSSKELMPIIVDYAQSTNYMIESLHIILTINVDGEVIDVNFPKDNLTLHLKETFKKKLLTMTGWTAGQKDGKPVCSTYYWPISCIKWK